MIIECLVGDHEFEPCYIPCWPFKGMYCTRCGAVRKRRNWFWMHFIRPLWQLHPTVKVIKEVVSDED